MHQAKQGFFYSLQPATHFIKQATEVNTSEKNASRAPEKSAPIMLVAAKVTAKRIKDSNTVPRIPIRRTRIVLQTHLRSVSVTAEIMRVIPRKITAIPKTTHKNAGVKVITAVKRRMAVIIPIIILAAVARPVQLNSQVQLLFIDYHLRL